MGKKQQQTKDDSSTNLERRHLVIGWAGLSVFLSLGIILEILHGLKLDLYLDVRNSTRRLMWTLAHAHGTLFSLVHLAFALTASRLVSSRLQAASHCLTWALILMPLGFLFGGLWLYGSDPGLGILLVPLGAISMLLGVLLTLRSVLFHRS